MRLIRNLSKYAFVLTILWIGFVLAISWMEAPLRFQPEQVSRTQALAIGRLVFHALNAVEISLAFGLGLFLLVGEPQARRITWLTGILMVILASQTGLLFTVLDQRTQAILQGQDVPPAIYHGLYIGLDSVKLMLLILLAVWQIQEFERQIKISIRPGSGPGGLPADVLQGT